jgi:hypothetical protein
VGATLLLTVAVCALLLVAALLQATELTMMTQTSASSKPKLFSFSFIARLQFLQVVYIRSAILGFLSLRMRGIAVGYEHGFREPQINRVGGLGVKVH